MAGKDELDDLKDLSPEDRIKKLKELEQKNKEEIEKAQALIRESEDEIELTEKLKQVEIPENHGVDVNRLFRGKEELGDDVSQPPGGTIAFGTGQAEPGQVSYWWNS